MATKKGSKATDMQYGAGSGMGRLEKQDGGGKSAKKRKKSDK
jgi:hypothetical protein